MSTAAKVMDLRIVERNPGYDRENNPLRLTVAELTPVELTWQSAGIHHSIRNPAGVIGRLLRDASGITVVEAPYEPSGNRAYIANADGSLRAQIPAQIGAERVAYYDVRLLNSSEVSFQISISKVVAGNSLSISAD
ncbi:hypothetical protein PQQ99_37090 [Paraburkholderia sediminicola]|uniref:hypothetical protein n=1 Tax=Paraburkholderia sediminicola TaxID=458836 RepID=UPI0038BAC6ED